MITVVFCCFFSVIKIVINVGYFDVVVALYDCFVPTGHFLLLALQDRFVITV